MPRNGAVLLRADRTMGELRSVARRAAHIAKELRREQDSELIGRYPLDPGEEIGDEVLDFLRLVVSEHQGQGVDIYVRAREGRDQGGPNGRGHLQSQGVRG